MAQAWCVVEGDRVVESHDSDCLVPWWSFTKTVLATAALALVRDGLLSLDRPLPGKPYTLRQLLQHRSGLANYGGLKAYHEAVERGDAPWRLAVLFEILDIDRLRYNPGEGWEYSNIGYLFVGEMIEKATGERLDQALHRLVLGPLGIEDAFMARQPKDLDGIEMGEASSYHPGWVYHGLMVGTLRSAALLLDRLMTGELLRPELVEAMITPFVLPGPVPERPWQVPGYGLGMMVGETREGKRVAGHTGGGPGSMLAVYRLWNADRQARTAAVFISGKQQAEVEAKAFAFL